MNGSLLTLPHDLDRRLCRCGACRDRRLFRVLGLAAARQERPLGNPGVVALIAFALLLTRVESAFAGRAFAAYGGVYIAASLFWLWLVEATRPDRWDLIGAAVCLGGAAIILFGPRSA